MIPVLLAGAAAIWGINNLDEAERKTRQASDINKEAAKISDAAYNRVKNSHGNMTDTLIELGRTKQNLMNGNIQTIADIMSKIYKKVKIDHDTQGLRELQEGGITELGLGEFKAMTQKAVDISKNAKNINTDDNHGWAATGALAATAVGLGVVAVLLLFCTASWNLIKLMRLYITQKLNLMKQEFMKNAVKIFAPCSMQ